MKWTRILFLAGLFLWAAGPVFAKEDRNTQVRNDRKNIKGSGFWIYNDLPKGFAEAKKTGKPLLIVFR